MNLTVYVIYGIAALEGGLIAWRLRRENPPIARLVAAGAIVLALTLIVGAIFRLRLGEI